MDKITQKEIQDALQRPPDFGYHGDIDELFITWTLGPVIETRDSTLLEKSNAIVLKRELEAAVKEGEIDADNWQITSCNHWAVGWVNHLSFKVLDDNGEPTKEWYWFQEWFDALSDYPVADEEHYSLLEYEATHENIEQVGSSFLHKDVPEHWVSEAYRWFSEYDYSAIESTDDQGGYPTDDQMRACLIDLGYYYCDMCEGDGWIYTDYVQLTLNGKEELVKSDCRACKGTGKGF